MEYREIRIIGTYIFLVPTFLQDCNRNLKAQELFKAELVLFFIWCNKYCLIVYLVQVYSPYNDGAGIESMSDARCLIVHRMSMLHSAMPLFANHLQLPRFTGQRRWHTMFGQ